MASTYGCPEAVLLIQVFVFVSVLPAIKARAALFKFFQRRLFSERTIARLVQQLAFYLQ